MGSDSTIFPPFLGANDKVAAFTPEICRSVEAYHVDNITYKGFKAYTYTADFGDMSSDPQFKCFCTTPDTCLKKGVHDLTNCVGAPFIASLPHFYLAHPDYMNAVYGMNPVKEKHEIYSVFEPMTATPVYAHRRLQLSIALHPIEIIEFMKEVPDVVFPILWVDEGIELNKKILDKVRIIFTLSTVMDVFKWISMIAGMGMGGASAFILKKMKDGMSVDVAPGQKPQTITPIEVNSRY
uniref:Chemosensory protein n=1 Tax=Blattella germanica TaxID=6973 RepID=A0A0X8DC62_BLAGE|nr:chemosensory protein [Blattella germanica]